MRYLYIAMGGALGALARWGIGAALAPTAAFPVGTLAANLSGCLLIGFLAPYTLQAGLPTEVRLGILTGFLGAYTTFSTWESGMLALFTDGHAGLGAAYLAASVVGGLLCVLGGQALAGLTRRDRA